LPDPADLGLREAADAIAAGELAASDLLEACRARAAAHDDLGAFVALAPDPGEPRPGPLRGIPVGVKDVVDVVGLPTRAGSGATDAEPAADDAPFVASLRDAGAVVLGKTATHELAYGVTTRATVNPWARDRLVGGSSGGSAVAVVVGACPLAVGSDTAGSCRIPAAFCGVAGMMARPGRLPMAGVVPLAPGLDTLGLLARTKPKTHGARQAFALEKRGIGGGAKRRSDPEQLIAARGAPQRRLLAHPPPSSVRHQASSSRAGRHGSAIR